MGNHYSNKRTFFRKYCKLMYAVTFGLLIGLGVTTIATSANSIMGQPLPNSGNSSATSRLLEQGSKALPQRLGMGQTRMAGSKVNEKGDLDFEWGSCPLTLADKMLTVHPGTMASVALDQNNQVTQLLQTDQVTAIKLEKGVVFPNDSSWLFVNMPNVTSIAFDKGIDTKNVTNMMTMFMGNPKLESLDLSNFDTSSVTNMGGMFANDPALTSLNIASFDTSKVTLFGMPGYTGENGMFANDPSLRSLDVSNFDTSGATNMDFMFFGNTALESVNVSNFDTENVTSMAMMFANDSKLKSLDLSSFDTRLAAKTIVSGVPGTSYMLGFKGDSGNGYMDWTLSDLWKIKVGSNTVIASAPFPNIVIGLPAAPGTANKERSFTDANFPGATFYNNGPDWQEVGTSTDGHNPTGQVLNASDLNMRFETARRTGNETWVWQQAPAIKQTVTLTYVDQNGKQIAEPHTISGYSGTSYDLSDAKYQLAIKGYTFTKVVGDLKGTIGTDPTTIKFEYTGGSTGNGGGSSSGGSTIPATPLGPSTTHPGTTPPTKPETPPGIAKLAFPFKVYAKTTVYKYRNVNFKKSQRIHKYAKQPRIKAPVFTVTKAVKNAQGRWRYRVAGGYITANEKNIGLLYWQSGKYRRLTVINPKGVYEYRSRLLAKHFRGQHLKRGTTVRVKRVTHDGMTTRYVLTNGHYITGNKKFVSVKY